MANVIVKIIILVTVFIIIGEAKTDYPKCNDFNTYMTALEVATDFCTNINYLIDSNLAYGIFLTNVNIKWTLQFKLPSFIHKRLRKLAGNLEWLTHVTPILKGDPYNSFSVFSSIKGFNIKPRAGLYKKLLVNIEELYKKHHQYENKVLNLQAASPNPSLSDHCIDVVLQNPRDGNHSKCSLDLFCREALIYGDNFGYGLTHRVFLFMMMHQSRACYAFSESQDREIIQRLCSYMYHESKYIIDKEGTLIDLVMECSTQCGQLGYDAFLNRRWMKVALELQSPVHGCFWNPNLERTSNVTIDDNGNKCEQHLTAVTMANLSIFIRYLVEKCFAYN